MDNIEQKLSKYFLNILDQAQNGIVFTDPKQDGNPLVYVNKYFEDMFGYSKEEVVGQNCRFLQKDDREQEAIFLMKTAITKKKTITTIIRNYSKDGTLIYNEVTISPIFDENNELIFFMGVQKDVTKNQILINNLKDMLT